MENEEAPELPPYLVPRHERGVIRQQPNEFGRTVLGAPLEVFLPQEPSELLIVAGQHGDEPEGTVLLSHLLRTIRPDALRAAVVLVLNPDGLVRGTRCNARGVDLNRNFPTQNWSPTPVCYRWSGEDPRDVDLSTGAAPSSEPETGALLSLMQKLAPRYVVSIHAPLSCIDDPFLTPLGKWLSAETALPLVENIGYPTPGSFGTWAKEQSLSLITFELSHASLEETRRRFSPALEALLRGSYPGGPHAER